MRLSAVRTLLLAAALAGCAVPPAPPPETAGEDIARIRLQQEEMTRALERLEDKLLVVEVRLRDQQQAIEQLRAVPPAEKVTPRGEKTGPTPTPPARPTPHVRPDTAGAPADLYQQAFGDYASGRHQQAIAGFETFLRLFPGHAQAGNALFWLGECYYARQQYPQAAEAFGKAAELFPTGGRAPEALLRMATALQQMGEKRRADEILQVLREKYPDSTAARNSLGRE